MSMCVTFPLIFTLTRTHYHLNLYRRGVFRASLMAAWETIRKCERNLMSQCARRLNATFLIGKADYFIRKAMMKSLVIVEKQLRRQDV